MATSNSDTTAKIKTERSRRRVPATSTASTSATSTTRPQTTVANVQHLAGRMILIPVGAGLVVRDDIVSTVKGFATRYVTRAGLERELKRYERRGGVARNRLERDVRRRRRGIERQLRSRRNRMERAVRQNRRRVEREVRIMRKDLGRRSDMVTARVEKLVSDAQELIGSIQ